MAERHHPSRVSRSFWIAGLGSLVWLLLRSGTNPRRLAYPCQRTALLSSSGFVGYTASILGTAHFSRLLTRGIVLAGTGLLTLTILLSAILVGSQPLVAPVYASLASLPGWTSPTAVSDVFVVPDVPVPECSLDGGTLPGTAPCNTAAYALRDRGVDTLVDAMESHGDYFYRTTAHPAGILGANNVVVIKINDQWGGQGNGDGRGRLSTNTDVLKGFIWRIVQHPDGFTGEIVIVENTQDENPGWNTTPANAQDQNQTYQDVVDAFQTLGYTVSLFSWDSLNYSRISGGNVDAGGYPAGEYATGNANDAYILLEDPAGGGTDELSYPKFQTANGHYVSMRYGVWNGTSYDADRLTFINMPVLKKHGMAGATIAWKNLIGFVTIAGNAARFGSWDAMHDFFWGYAGGANRNYGLIGRELALVRHPDLNVVDAIWAAIDDNTYGKAVRQNVLLASTDPFAVDWYSSEYVLRPVISYDSQDSSAARAGTFRDATRTNQNSASAVWPGGSYPYIDLLDGYDGNTPSNDEKNQMNVYVAAVASPTPTATPTATTTPTPSVTPTATPTKTASECVSDVNGNGTGDVADVMYTASTAGCLVYLPVIVATWHKPWPTVTPTPTATQTPPPQVAGCDLFPADNVWNVPVDTLPVDANSASYVNTIGSSAPVHADFGSGDWPPGSGRPIGIPYADVAGTQPKVTVTFDYADESDAGPYPIPTDVPIEGGPDSVDDRHVLIVEHDNCVLYELFYAWPQSNGNWTAGSGAIFDLRSNTLRPAGWTSADAAGLPMLPGLLRYDEVAGGAVRHAIRFTAPQTRRAYIWPARHFASSLTGAQYPPMGQRFRLKSSFAVSGFSPHVQVILQAMKKYGIILADNGGAWFISGVPDARWNNDVLHELNQVHGSDFEAVDESSLMVNANSGQTNAVTP
ncbi:MAG: DUF362 domain-containing protein [Chloroflexi bacterium]|nr:DUF362 domain-containing protein [Chloroflexota bacterium]